MPVHVTTPRVLIRTCQPSRLALESAAALESIVDEAPTDESEPGFWLAAEVVRSVDATIHPWDAAHGVVDAPEAAGLEAMTGGQYVEPDFVQAFPYELSEPESLEGAFERAEACQPRKLDADWPNPAGRFAWHLDDDYSQLRAARKTAGDPGDGQRILVGILDTGYDPGHASLPLHVRYDLARNLTGDGPITNATDPGSSFPLTNPGHGTATLALLAGKQISRFGPPAFNDVLGGAPWAAVVPIRVADSVIHFRTSAMAQGIEYAAGIGCRVVSISMGGVPTQLWAAAVNKAYESGVCIFAAAGNRIGPAPPETLVYPARFGRVVAVCGFMADKTPYYRDGLHRKMHGCFGPPAAMKTAMAAFTPNAPWAGMGCGELVHADGAGTSSATPQCAAAAALWLQMHRPSASEKWRVVEAVRHALFSTADRTPAAGTTFFGNGLLRAKDALGVEFRNDLPKTPVAEVSFPWLRLIGALESVDEQQAVRQKMFETEALQLFLLTPSLQRIAGEADPETDDLDRPTLKELVDRFRQLPTASKTLKRHLDHIAVGL